MEIHALASTISDNFFYLAVDGGDGLLVDPYDAPVAIEAVRRLSLERVRIFTTHGHPDHCDGNGEVVDALGCEVLASGHAVQFPVEADTLLRDGDTLSVGATTFSIHWAPGHTDGHLVAATAGHALSGDVYFVGGCGHCRFGGNVDDLYETFAQRLAGLADTTRFYPGHDYAAHNLAFCLSIEPEHPVAQGLHERAQGHRREQGPFLLTLGEERSYNPFHRTEDPALQAHLRSLGHAVEDGRSAFRTLRALRDAF